MCCRSERASRLLYGATYQYVACSITPVTTIAYRGFARLNIAVHHLLSRAAARIGARLNGAIN